MQCYMHYFIFFRILWNLEEDNGSSIHVHDVFQDYTHYCEENGLHPATNIVFGKMMYLVFPTVRNVHYTGTRKYVNVRRKNNGTNKQYQFPDYCTVHEFPDSMEVLVPSEHIRNKEHLEWKIQFAQNRINVTCMETQVPLGVLGISTFAPLVEPYVSTAVTSLRHVRFCKGADWSQEIDMNPETWSLIGDENTLLHTIRSPSCSRYLPILGNSYTCENCRKLRNYKCAKRKLDDTSSCEGERVDSPGETDNQDTAIESIIPGAPDGLKKLIKSQIRNNKPNENKDPRHRRWDPEIISMALSLWCRSPRAYNALKDSGMLVLPTDRTLR